jgi:hypothetical protein
MKQKQLFNLLYEGQKKTGESFTIYKMVFTALVFLTTIGSQAQYGTFEWAKQFESFNNLNPKCITTDAAGNIYTAGSFNGNADFDPSAGTFNLNSKGLLDVYVTKLDASGNLIWAKSMGGTSDDVAYGISVDALGNVYTTGYCYPNADFDPGPGTYNIATNILGSMNDRIFVSKLDASGNFVWANDLPSGGSSNGRAIFVDPSGNVYTTGYFHGTTDFDPGAGTFNLTSGVISNAYVSKLDTSGNFVWARAIVGSATGSSVGNGISVDAMGNVYTTGSFTNTVDFDSGASTFNLTSAGSKDIFVSKLDASGDFVWAKKMGGTSVDEATAISIDASGNIFTTGSFALTVDFDPNTGTSNLTSAGNLDIFVAKLDASGNFVWAKRMGGTNQDLARGISLDTSGNVYTAGYFQGTADFDPDTCAFNITSAGTEDIFVAKLDASGNFVWANGTGGTGSDSAFGISVDSSNNVYTTGLFAGTVNFGTSTAVSNLIAVGSLSDIFVAKVGYCSSPAAPTAAAQLFNSGATVASLVATGTALQWYNTATCGPALASNTVLTTGTYYVSQTIGCDSSRTAVAVTVINTTPAPTAVATQSFCPGTTVASLVATGSALKWYNVAINGIALAANTVLETGNYYVSQTLIGTEGPRTQVSVTLISSIGSIAAISGLASVCGVSSTTYSVPVVANATNYIWTFPAGIIATSSLGRTVSVSIDPTFTEGELTVSASNSCGTTAIKTFKVYNKPVISEIIGLASICGATTANYSVISQANTTYTWSVPTGINITSGQGTAAITVDVNASNFVYGVVTAVANSNCGVSNKAYFGVVGIEMPTKIIGLIQLCNVTSTTYSTPAISGATFTWSVPTGITITSGQGTNVITVSVDGSFSSGEVGVVANSTCGTSMKRGLLVTNAKSPGIISGPATLCGAAIITYDTSGNIINNSSSQVVYSVPAVTGATNYTWTLPVGATIASGQGTTTIAVNFDIATFVNGNISVTATTSCSTSTPSTLFVRKASGFIAGLTQLCDVTTTTYSVPATIGSGFVWTVPSWMTISSGQNTNSITVTIGSPICQEESVGLTFLSNCNTNETLSLATGCSQFSKINSNQCGTTLAKVTTSVSAIIPSEAGILSMYKIRIYDGTSYQYIENTTGRFSFTSLTNWNYGATYTVDVALKINGAYKPYGCACNITLPSIPLSQINALQCGTTLSSLGSNISADYIPGSQMYRYEVTNGATVTTLDVNKYNFSLTQIPGIIYGTTYGIRVAVKVGGTWGEYGSSCNVTTPTLITNTVPTATIHPNFCGATLATLDTKIAAALVYGATKARFEVTIAGGSPVVYEVAAYNFKLSQTGVAVLYNTSYSIRVAALVGGVWGNYGASCTVTTPSAPIARLKAKSFEVAAYPNPFDSAFNLNLETPSKEEVTIAVYDMMGKLVETHQVNPTEVANLQIGSHFAVGIYNVIVSQANEMQAIRLIRK